MSDRQQTCTWCNKEFRHVEGHRCAVDIIGRLRIRLDRLTRRALRLRCGAEMTVVVPNVRCVLREGHAGLHDAGVGR